MEEHKTHVIKGYDVNVTRPQLVVEDFALRGQGMSRARLRGIRKGLQTLHTLETMAVCIYRFQITRKKSEHDRLLVAAMCSEMTHLQDFQVKLYEYGFRPSMFRTAYWLVGLGFALYSRLRGKRAILKMGIWVESKAVVHYAELLDEIEWDDDTRKIVEKNASDEQGHIDRWRSMLEAAGA